MRETNVIKLGIVIAVITVIVVGIIYTWDTVRDKQADYTGNMPEYHTESEDVDQAAFDGNEIYINPETSYRVLLEDDALLLDDTEALELAALMYEITAYGNAAFKTTDNNDWNTESYARQYYQEQFGIASGTLFLIDMDNRNIWIHSDGAKRTQNRPAHEIYQQCFACPHPCSAAELRSGKFLHRNQKTTQKSTSGERTESF